MRNIFQRKKRNVSTGTLPRHVEDALFVAKYMNREPTENGHRTMISMPGLGHLVIQDTKDLDARVKRAWPELDERQVARVLKHIDVGMRAAIARDTALPGRPKQSWAREGFDSDNYPIKTAGR